MSDPLSLFFLAAELEKALKPLECKIRLAKGLVLECQVEDRLVSMGCVVVGICICQEAEGQFTEVLPTAYFSKIVDPEFVSSHVPTKTINWKGFLANTIHPIEVCQHRSPRILEDIDYWIGHIKSDIANKVGRLVCEQLWPKTFSEVDCEPIGVRL